MDTITPTSPTSPTNTRTQTPAQGTSESIPPFTAHRINDPVKDKLFFGFSWMVAGLFFAFFIVFAPIYFGIIQPRLSKKEETHKVIALPPQQDAKLLSMGKNMGLDDIDKFALIALRSSDTLFSDSVKTTVNVEAASFREPISTSTVYENSLGTITVISDTNEAITRQRLVHGYYHYVWLHKVPDKEALSPSLAKLESSIPTLKAFREKNHSTIDIRSEIYAYSCSSLPDSNLEPILAESCQRYRNRN